MIEKAFDMFNIVFVLGGEAIDWAVEISLCERCAERKNGNYHSWNHRQWVLQKATNLLNYEIVKTEKFIRKNIADYSCYHHRHFVLMKLFDQQYFDIHDTEVNELYQFVNDSRTDDAKINNIKDLAASLLPKVDLNSVNRNKLNSFLFSLNLAIHDLNMMHDLIQLHGKYEAFNCYKRVVIKFAIDVVQLCNTTDYLAYEQLTKAPTPLVHNDAAQAEIIQRLLGHLDSEDGKYAKIFF